MAKTRLSISTTAVAGAALFGCLLAASPVRATPLAGDQTIVLLTSAAVLSGAGLTVGGIGSAVIAPDIVGRVEAAFPITGGDLSGLAGTIEHDGSGLSLTSGPNTLSLENFLIDTTNLLLTADVSLNGSLVGSVPILDVAQCTALVGTGSECIDGDASILLDGFKLTLTQAAASALSDIFGVPDLTGAQFGVARIDVRLVPEPGTMLLVGLGLAATASRRRMITR